MKKLLVLIASFSIVGQTFSLGNPFANVTLKVSNPVSTEEVKAFVGKKVEAGKAIKAKTKALQEQLVVKAEALISSNPKAAIACTVVATLVLEHVLSIAYDKLFKSDNSDQDDEDLDIA